MTNVAILGCGPAGLMAAEGAHRAGANVRIYSRKQKSELHGAQFLHAPIPGHTHNVVPRQVDYILRGTEDQYRRKVYGTSWDGKVSPEEFKMVDAWDIRQTYDSLWEKWEMRIMDVDVDFAGLKVLVEDHELIVSSIPRNFLCHKTDQGHAFYSMPVIAAGDAPSRGIYVSTLYKCKDETVVCNGEEQSWYRMSRVYGHTTVEWPQGINVPIATASVVNKPLSHNCDCLDALPVVAVGRYGKWRKGVLSHTAYAESFEATDAIDRAKFMS